MIVSVKPSEVDDVCANSRRTEGVTRKNDPVHGCYGFVHSLKAEVDAAESELAAVKRHLALCKNDQSTAAAAAMARHMILRRGGLDIPASPVPESPALSLSLSMPGGRAKVDRRPQQNHQGVHQMLDGLKFPRVVEMFNSETQDEYVYRSPKKESTGNLNPNIDLQMLDQMGECCSQPRNVLSLGSSHVMADQSSFSIKVKGNQIVAEQKVKGGMRTPWIILESEGSN